MSTPEEKPVASTGEFKIRKRTRKTKATTIKRDIDDEVENEEVSIPELRKQTVKPKFEENDISEGTASKKVNVTLNDIAERKELVKEIEKQIEIKSDTARFREQEEQRKNAKDGTSKNPHQYVKKTLDQVRMNKFTGVLGPIRRPAHFTPSNQVEYQLGICKDYKETGYCSFGDSCIFIHDRSDYKAGWQIDKEFEEEQRRKRKKMEENKGDDDDDDEDNKYVIDTSDEEENDLPFACFICRKPFVNPVKTNCGHYFCQNCALENYKKSSKCFVCNAETSGCFNRAVEIEKKMKGEDE